MKKLTPALGAPVLFIILFSIGFILSQNKPLWNDEIYSQTAGIERLTYFQIIQGKIPEGNACPLFYLIQKGMCEISRYHSPNDWAGEWSISDPKSQIILRIVPNIFISLTILLLFIYFSHNHSQWAGIYALVTALSSSMIWAHWAEARPYALWFFLTTAQCLLFLRVINNKESTLAWKCLIITHLLIALTIVVGIMQITIVSLLLWLHKSACPLKGDRQKIFLNCLFLTVLPICITLFYYFQAPKYHFFFLANPLRLILVNAALEHVLLFAIYAFFLVIFFILNKRQTAGLYLSPKNNKEGKYFLALTALMFAAAFILLTILKIKDIGLRPGFEVSPRYVIYLAPVSLIAAILFSIHIIQTFKAHKWILINVIMGLSALLIIRVLNAYIDVSSLRLY